MSSIEGSKISKSQWFAHVEQWRSSGLTRSEYCKANGITVHGLSYWVTRHREQSQQSGQLTLIPAKVTDHVDDTRATTLVLHCPNGSQLHLPAGTPAIWLGTLLAQLR